MNPKLHILEKFGRGLNHVMQQQKNKKTTHLDLNLENKWLILYWLDLKRSYKHIVYWTDITACPNSFEKGA